MALGDPYATLAQLKDYMQGSLDGVTTYDAVLGDVLDSVSREIEQHCNRQFNQAGLATQRSFAPDAVFTLTEDGVTTHWAAVDDFWDTSGLVVTSGGTIWSPSDYALHPRNGVVGGQLGWPYWEIHAAGALRFDPAADVLITAKWGWPSVPTPVKQACLILASETFQIKDAPFGVAGLDTFGTIRVRDNRMALSKLAPYVREPLQVR